MYIIDKITLPNIFSLAAAILFSLPAFSQITTNTNFKANIAEPLDKRCKIATLADTVTIGFVYPGAITFVSSEAKLYLRQTTGWVPVATNATWATLSGIPSDFADGIDNVNDADFNSTNELQNIDTLQLVSNILGISLSSDGVPLKTISLASYLDNTDAQALSGSYNQATNILTINLTGSTPITYNLSDLEDTITQEIVQDFVGSMVTGNTETNVNVTYNDASNTFDFVVDLSAYVTIASTSAWDKSTTDDITTINQGTGITVSGTGNSRTITNSAPDQTVSILGAGTVSVTGTYPSFTVTGNADGDGSTTNEKISSVNFNNSNRIFTITENGINYADTINTQTLSLSAGKGTIGLSNSNKIIIADSSATNELQTISKDANRFVTLSNGGGTFRDSVLTESQVDAYAGNNGYLSSEVDGSVTNEIQDIDTLQLVSGELQISLKNDGKPLKKVNIPSGGSESTTVGDTPTIDLSMTGYNITGIVKPESIDSTHIGSMSISATNLAETYLTSEKDGSVNNEKISSVNYNKTNRILTVTENSIAYSDTIHTDNSQDAIIVEDSNSIGALIINPIHYTGTGKNATGTNSIDLQFERYNVNQTASGTGSVAIGSYNSVPATNSYTIGKENNVKGYDNSVIGVGNGTEIDEGNNIIIGYANSTTKSDNTILGNSILLGGTGNVAIGSQISTNANYTASIGWKSKPFSFLETAIGFKNEIYTPASTTAWNDSDKLFDIGKGDNVFNKSAFSIYKSGVAMFHPIDTTYLTPKRKGMFGFMGNDVVAYTNNKWNKLDLSATNELQTISKDGNRWVTLSNGGGIFRDSILTESQVDGYVGNNGYLTNEVDGSITNEKISSVSFNTSNRIFTITENGTDYSDTINTQTLSLSAGKGTIGLSGSNKIILADSSSTNELQTISKDANRFVTLSNGGGTFRDSVLTEAQVDSYVGNNGYITSEIDGSVTNEKISSVSFNTSNRIFTITENGTNYSDTINSELPTQTGNSGKVLTTNGTTTSWTTAGTNYWTANGNNIYKNNSGNVGINETSPAFPLIVKGTTGTAAENIAYIGESNSTFNGLYVRVPSTGNGGHYAVGIQGGLKLINGSNYSSAITTSDGSMGTAGQVLTSGGPDQPVTWTTVSGGGGGVTSVTGASPIVSSGGTTPQISLSLNSTTMENSSGLNAKNTSALWNANQIQSKTVSSTVPTTGQVLKYDGTNWAPGTDATGGSGSTNLSFTGTSSPVTLNSSSGTGVRFLAGTNISLSQSGNDLTINASGGGATNLSVSGTAPTYNINSNTGTDVSITAGNGLTASNPTTDNITLVHKPTQIDTFISSGTWNKPAGAQSVYVIVIGGGGGGGGGDYRDGGTANTGVHGGGGGAAGARSEKSFDASKLPSSVVITVGSGGSGGLGGTGTTAPVSGQPGGSGGNSFFGTFIKAEGGLGGGASGNNYGGYPVNSKGHGMLSAGISGGTGARYISGSYITPTSPVILADLASFGAQSASLFNYGYTSFGGAGGGGMNYNGTTYFNGNGGSANLLEASYNGLTAFYDYGTPSGGVGGTNTPPNTPTPGQPMKDYMNTGGGGGASYYGGGANTSVRNGATGNGNGAGGGGGAGVMRTTGTATWIAGHGGSGGNGKVIVITTF